jgi:predicted transcriptional regulator
MKAVRATFSLDVDTQAAIQRLAAAWSISKSAVIRKAVQELDARRDLLSEEERQKLLGALDRWLATDATRPRSEALAEVEEVRAGRRAAGQGRP